MSRMTYVRHTGTERLMRFAVYFCCVLAIVLSVKSIEVIPEFLADAPTQMKDLFVRMWPIDFASYGYGAKDGVHIALIDTLAISFLATVLGLILATPVGFLAARNINRIVWLNAVARFILIATRSVSTLLWALFFVAMFGPGALAGTCAIAFHSIGFIGRMLSEALEESNKGTIEALTAAGAPWYSRILYGYWPQVAPAYWSVALFRWDINVRESAVLGLVGAGGIGMALNSAIDLFKWDQVALILIVIFAVVALSEVLVTGLRRRLI
ncbi:MAG: phosphonate ABC transporter, permease protein PhnE [Cytophagales bacterium]|nr:phosphonate ABC transporter, permease protein PhnE [Cytophagales bacterium]